MNTQLFTETKKTVSIIKASDNETLTGAIVDMQGYTGVLFVVVVESGEALAGYKLYAQQGTQVGGGDQADLLGSAVSFSSSATLEVIQSLDIYKPRERYVRPKVDVPNMVAATPVAVIALRYGPIEFPVTGENGKVLIEPAEGTP